MSTPITLSYSDPDSITVRPWHRSCPNGYSTIALASVDARDRLYELEIEDHGDVTAWSAIDTGTDEDRHGTAPSPEAARPQVEDALIALVRAQREQTEIARLRAEIARLQARIAEMTHTEPADPFQAALDALHVGTPDEDLDPEGTAALDALLAGTSTPKRPSTPCLPADVLLPLGRRILRQRMLRGVTWDALAQAAAAEGGPAVTGRCYAQWAHGQHGPQRGDHRERLLTWLQTAEGHQGTVSHRGQDLALAEWLA